MSAGRLQGGGPGIQMRGLVSAPPTWRHPAAQHLRTLSLWDTTPAWSDLLICCRLNYFRAKFRGFFPRNMKSRFLCKIIFKSNQTKPNYVCKTGVQATSLYSVDGREMPGNWRVSRASLA